MWAILAWICEVAAAQWQRREEMRHGPLAPSSLLCRTTSSLAIWYLIHCIVTFNAPNLANSCHVTIHKSRLWLHSLLYLGLWVGFWFVSDSFFHV
jgi:hypothetical protein